jgi:hypothetical protein
MPGGYPSRSQAVGSGAEDVTLAVSVPAAAQVFPLHTHSERPAAQPALAGSHRGCRSQANPALRHWGLSCDSCQPPCAACASTAQTPDLLVRAVRRTRPSSRLPSPKRGPLIRRARAAPPHVEPSPLLNPIPPLRLLHYGEPGGLAQYRCWGCGNPQAAMQGWEE